MQAYRLLLYFPLFTLYFLNKNVSESFQKKKCNKREILYTMYYRTYTNIPTSFIFPIIFSLFFK